MWVQISVVYSRWSFVDLERLTAYFEITILRYWFPSKLNHDGNAAITFIAKRYFQLSSSTHASETIKSWRRMWTPHDCCQFGLGFSHPCIFLAIGEIICRLTNVDIHAVSERRNIALLSQLKGTLDCMSHENWWKPRGEGTFTVSLSSVVRLIVAVSSW